MIMTYDWLTRCGTIRQLVLIGTVYPEIENYINRGAGDWLRPGWLTYLLDKELSDDLAADVVLVKTLKIKGIGQGAVTADMVNDVLTQFKQTGNEILHPNPFYKEPTEKQLAKRERRKLRREQKLSEKIQKEVQKVVSALPPPLINVPVVQIPSHAKKVILTEITQGFRKPILELDRCFTWKKLRLIAIRVYGRTCMACGETEGRMDVDHIIPRMYNPDLTLEITNLQILCHKNKCHEGKFVDSWDFRRESDILKLNEYLIGQGRSPYKNN